MKKNETRLAQLEAENAFLRAENASMITEDIGVNNDVINRFWTHVNPMQMLDGTPHVTDNRSVLQNETDIPVDTCAAKTPIAPSLNPTHEAVANRSKDDSCIESMVYKHLEAMEVLIKRLLGVAPLITKSTHNCYADTHGRDHTFWNAKEITFPSRKMYDEMTDPGNHISQCKQRMFTTTTEREYLEANMCKEFGSIESFASLTDRFVERFASSRNLEKIADDMYEMRQKKGESLRKYVWRFNKEKVSIPCCVTSTVISTFKRSLLLDGDMYKELTKYQCRTMEYVLSRAWAYIKWEENPIYHHRHSPQFDSRVGMKKHPETTILTTYNVVKIPAVEETTEAFIDHSTKIESENRLASTRPYINNKLISHA